MKTYRIIKPDGSVMVEEFATKNIGISLTRLFLDNAITNAEKCVVQEKVGDSWVNRITFGEHKKTEPVEDDAAWTLEDILAREG